MKHWFNNNYKTLIIAAFLIPIITVAIVSISHVTKWYGISNPVTWSVYLSIGIEIAALSALAAISANMGKKVYFPFAIVTLIQFIGNIFFAYTYIDINSQEFKDWVGLVSPLVEFMGVDPTDFVGHKRFLAFFAGGMLPIISLSFLHMLVKFTEEDRKKEEEQPQTPEQLKDFVDETTRIRLSENDLKKLEEVLLNPPAPNENLVKATEEYKNIVSLSDEDILNRAQEIQMKKTFERMKKIEEHRESIHGPILPEDEPVGALANSEYREEKERKLQEILDIIEEEERIQKEKQDILDNTIDLFDQENEKVMEDFVDNVIKNNSEIENGKWVSEEKLKQRELLTQITQQDEELGLYDEEPYAGPSIFPKEVEYTDEYNKPLYENPTQTVVEPQIDLELVEDESFPTVHSTLAPTKEPWDIRPIEEFEENISDWDATLMDGLEDEPPFFTEEELEKITQEEPTEEEIQGNFSTIEPNTENIFQDNEFLIPVDEAIDNEPELTFSDEFLTEAIEEFNQESIEEELEESIPETITLPFEPIPLPIELNIEEVPPVIEEVIEQTPIGQTEDLTDEKKN